MSVVDKLEPMKKVEVHQRSIKDDSTAVDSLNPSNFDGNVRFLT